MRTGVCSRGSTVRAMDIVRQVTERIATGLPSTKEEPTQHSDSSSRAPLTSGEVGSVYLGRMEDEMQGALRHNAILEETLRAGRISYSSDSSKLDK